MDDQCFYWLIRVTIRPDNSCVVVVQVNFYIFLLILHPFHHFSFFCFSLIISSRVSTFVDFLYFYRFLPFPMLLLHVGGKANATIVIMKSPVIQRCHRLFLPSRIYHKYNRTYLIFQVLKSVTYLVRCLTDSTNFTSADEYSFYLLYRYTHLTFIRSTDSAIP